MIVSFQDIKGIENILFHYNFEVISDRLDMMTFAKYFLVFVKKEGFGKNL